MNNSKMKKYYFIAAAIALLAVFVAAPAGAGGHLDSKLHGKYAWNSTQDCALSLGGIDPDTFERLPVRGTGGIILGITNTYVMQAEFSFKGNGEFDYEGKVLAIIHEPYRANPLVPFESMLNNFYVRPVISATMVGEGTYSVTHEGNVGITFTKTTLTYPDGRNEVYSGSTSQGRLDTATGSSIVFLSSTDPAVDNVYNVVDGDLVLKGQRICNGTGSMVKLSPWRYWFSNEQTDLPKPKK